MTDIRSMYLFRDQQVALDFQKMAAEGYIDTEFTMYGITCYQNGERHYLVSSDGTRILDATAKSDRNLSRSAWRERNDCS